ncbi:DUF4407 domain-containing protein [Prevotella sp. P6B1]|uniref:DUF4407 domain-containing protein n=1 Tax=Prevotella sp. P6B1 TaxID=1410613 RepID=UPI00051C1D77|nr:DUF4407 domain-containing protein [Prevotella sp. P6B1]
MKTLTNIGCFLIGWNKEILNECGEASHRQFRKLLSAICIMMALWGTIGYCFAERYINIESTTLKVMVSMMFMLIVLCVERVIILTVGKARLMTLMRVMLALCMAVLGSCIFDQIIFSNDIRQAIQERREDVIKETILKRMSIFDNDEKRITQEMDSLNKATIALGEELMKKPTIKSVNVSTQEQVVGVDENGNPKKARIRNTEIVNVANPLAEQLKSNNSQIEIYQNQLEQLRQDKKDIAKKVTEEVSMRPLGFIEELEATLSVVSKSVVSLVFYIVLFCFLTFLELFVLTIKMGDTKCDYDLIVENQLRLKRTLMDQTSQSLITKRVA